MGAEHVWLIPSEPVAGVKQFLTTNGKALFNHADGCFYLYDTMLVVRIDSSTWSPTSYERHGPYLIKELIVEGEEISVVRLQVSDGDRAQDPRRKTLYPPYWKDGLGSAVGGFFPSAHKSPPSYKHLLDDMTVS